MKAFLFALSAGCMVAACGTVEDYSGPSYLGAPRPPTYQQGVRAAVWAKTDSQPTGYQIRGCANYVIDGWKVRQICGPDPELALDRQMNGGISP